MLVAYTATSPLLPPLERVGQLLQVVVLHGRLHVPLDRSDGLTNRQISSKLWTSEGTVKAHVGNVIRKLGVSNRTQAVVVGLSPQPAARLPGSPNVQPKDTRSNASLGAPVLPLDRDDANRRGLLRIVR
jgi:Bacterial regulatory proteins, luxR family